MPKNPRYYLVSRVFSLHIKKCYTKEVKLIFAQGNPGTRYETTRHNVGFLAIDYFVSLHSLAFQSKPKFNADVAEYTHGGEKIILVKPMTFYNETGISARALIDFYKIDSEDVLVIHDELALPFGTIRTRGKGSDAGNNGIKSLNAHIGPTFTRVRVGIANDISERAAPMNFVLASFSSDEKEILTDAIFPEIATIITSFAAGSLEYTSFKIASPETSES